jgi:hypothetical protein
MGAEMGLVRGTRVKLPKPKLEANKKQHRTTLSVILLESGYLTIMAAGESK